VPYEYTRTCYKDQVLSCGKCVDENTYITMNDFTQKKIKNIKINDVILGITKINGIKQIVPSTVLNFYNQGIKETITIENELSNQLTLTPDHECLTITSKSNNTKYRPIEKILISKYPYLFCYDYTIKDKDFYEGWIAGYLSHDGQFNYQLEQKTNNKYLNIKCLCQDIIEEKEVRQILYEQGYDTFDSKHHTNDGEFRCFKIYKQNQTKYIQHLISNEHNISKNFKLGWVTGAIDADGYYDKHSIRYFKSDSRYNLFLKFIKFLDDLNISYNIQTTKRKNVVINNRKINVTPNNVIVISKRNAFKLPTNLSKRVNQFKNITIQRSKSIVKLISKQKSNVIDITTTTGNFIANGMIIHNCGSCSERLEAFKQIGKIDPIEYHQDYY
jgi:intein/homing endonuclease